jgi:hypothetical protein
VERRLWRWHRDERSTIDASVVDALNQRIDALELAQAALQVTLATLQAEVARHTVKLVEAQMQRDQETIESCIAYDKILN